MTNKILIFSLLGFATVYCQTPCSHHYNSEPKSESTNQQLHFEQAPAATKEFFNQEYLPPPSEFLPQANQAKPVYVAPPVQKQVIQPLPTLTQPKLVPLPKLQPPVYNPQPTPVKPTFAPLPKLQPLPQISPVKPVFKPLPSTPLPKLAPLPKLPPAVPKITSPSRENDIQPSNLVGVKYGSEFLVKPLNPIPQATNVVPKFVKPDLEPAAQTNRLSIVNPDSIKIDHYICNQGNAEQKFLCDILKLWDIHHPKDINGNDLDNPGDNSNNLPTYAKLPTTPKPLPTTTRPVTYATLPTSPRPVITTTTTTTPAPELEADFENVPGDSQQNVNAIYLPPYSTTVKPTTVEIPKREPAPSNNNYDLLTPDNSQTSTYTVSTTTTTTTVAPQKEGYEYPKPSIPFPVVALPEKDGYEYPKPSIPFPVVAVPEKDGYDYPKPAIPFDDGANFPKLDLRFSNVPLSSFQYPGLSVDSSKSSFASFSDSLNQYPFGAPIPSFSPVVTSTTLSPDIFLKSTGEYFNSPSISYSYQPLLQPVTNDVSYYSPSVTYSDPSLSTISPFTYTTPAPSVYSSAQPTFSYSTPISQPVSTLAPLLLSKESLALSSNSKSSDKTSVTTEKAKEISTEKPTVTSTVSPSLPDNFNSQFFGFNSVAPFSYSFQPAPLGSGLDQSQFSFLPSSTVSPLEQSNFISSEKSVLQTTASPFAGNYNSDLFGQYFNSLSPLSYNAPPSVSSISSGNSDLSLLGAKSNFSNFGYQPVGQSFPSGPSIGYTVQQQPLSLPSFGSGQNYNFPAYNPSFPSGPSSINVPSQGQSYSSGQISSSNSLPLPKFQSFGQTQSSQFQSKPSGLSFSSNVQSVENLKDLQAESKKFDLDLRFGSSSKESQFSDNSQIYGSPDSKEDISLGNIEILKVKRKL